jgi:hypothetical protein
MLEVGGIACHDHIDYILPGFPGRALGLPNEPFLQAQSEFGLHGQPPYGYDVSSVSIMRPCQVSFKRVQLHTNGCLVSNRHAREAWA